MVFLIEFDRHADLNTRPNLNAVAINQIENEMRNGTIPLPPLETQKQIAKTLNTASEHKQLFPAL